MSDNNYTLLNEESRVAFKRHKCVHCDKPIEPGTKYIYTASVMCGSFEVERWHTDCRDEYAQENIEAS